MVRENLSVDTSFEAFIYSENAVFSSLATASLWNLIFPYWVKWVLLYSLYGMALKTHIINFWLKYTLAVFP